jgi:hypothetical protein
VEVIALDFAARAFFVLGSILATVAFSKAPAQVGVRCLAGIGSINSFGYAVVATSDMGVRISCASDRGSDGLYWSAKRAESFFQKILDSLTKRADTYPNSRMLFRIAGI